ncbi:hypothetical protein ANO11243_084700 [Dothideomycetidae sp. 11243]|nr:hypothetical protein ANO11243_084700 [fungal sp. No.11243]
MTSHTRRPAWRHTESSLAQKASAHGAVKVSSEIVKSTGEPVMTDGIYPMMQLLDAEYLDVDAEFGETDQRETFALAHDTMTKIGSKVRAHL